MSLFPLYTPAKVAKAAKVETTLSTPELALAGLAAPLVSKTPVAPLPKWQHDFCIAHAMFNGWLGNCPCSLDNCLFSKIIVANGDIEKLRGLEIGQGITTDQVIDEWQGSGELSAVLFDKPVWLICMAEYLKKVSSRK